MTPHENVDLLTKFDSFLHDTTSNDNVNSELDCYLEENVLPLKPGSDISNFDVLEWWDINGARYLTLKYIARDILAVPVSTCTSESVFKTGRVLSLHRDKLNPTTLEALICA